MTRYRAARLVVRPVVLFLAVAGTGLFLDTSFRYHYAYHYGETIRWAAIVCGALWITYEVSLVMLAAENRRRGIVAREVDVHRLYPDATRP